MADSFVSKFMPLPVVGSKQNSYHKVYFARYFYLFFLFLNSIYSFQYLFKFLSLIYYFLLINFHFFSISGQTKIYPVLFISDN